MLKLVKTPSKSRRVPTPVALVERLVRDSELLAASIAAFGDCRVGNNSKAAMPAGQEKAAVALNVARPRKRA